MSFPWESMGAFSMNNSSLFIQSAYSGSDACRIARQDAS